MHARLAVIALGTSLALQALSSAVAAQTSATPALRYYAPLPPAIRPRVIETNLCVYGGTPGGLCAAIQMRRLGKSFYFEPKVAERTLQEMVREAGVEVLLEQRLESVRKDGNRIVEIVMESGNTCRAPVFVDASYEGDLMATTRWTRTTASAWCAPAGS